MRADQRVSFKSGRASSHCCTWWGDAEHKCCNRKQWQTGALRLGTAYVDCNVAPWKIFSGQRLLLSSL